MGKTTIILLTIALSFLVEGAYSGSVRLESIVVPDGFKIELVSDDAPGARSMALSPRGTLFVGTRTEGKVYALRDTDRDFTADELYVIASGLNMPNGVAFHGGSLYVAEVNRVLRYDDIENSLDNPPEPIIVNDSFPTDRHHGWKYIAFGPDDKLYVPVGAPCNVCEVEDPYAAITRMGPDGSNLEVFARGVRNTVGFDWHPETGELWFTDNGRDLLGDDSPPDELNLAPKAGLHFGFPYLHGSDVRDPEFGEKGTNIKFTKPAQELGPHVASLGMKFYTGSMFPEEYRGRIFIAEHGSWNRSEPIGYRITTVTLDGDEAVSYDIFAEGWLQGDKAWGRPVDVLILPDGSMLVSDDKAGAVYRISYKK